MTAPEGGLGERDLEIPLPRKRRIYVRLEDLPAEDGDARGRRTRLKEPSAHVIRLANQYDQEPATHADLLWDIAAGLLPELTSDEVASLGYGTILSILEIGRRPIAELEDVAKNAAPPSA